MNSKRVLTIFVVLLALGACDGDGGGQAKGLATITPITAQADFVAFGQPGWSVVGLGSDWRIAVPPGWTAVAISCSNETHVVIRPADDEHRCGFTGPGADVSSDYANEPATSANPYVGVRLGIGVVHSNGSPEAVISDEAAVGASLAAVDDARSAGMPLPDDPLGSYKGVRAAIPMPKLPPRFAWLAPIPPRDSVDGPVRMTAGIIAWGKVPITERALSYCAAPNGDPAASKCPSPETGQPVVLAGWQWSCGDGVCVSTEAVPGWTVAISARRGVFSTEELGALTTLRLTST